MKSRKIILSIIIFLIISLCILFFLHQYNINKQNKTNTQNKENIFDTFSNIDNASPIYQNCAGNNNNCPLNKKKLVREETPDGYKIGDDHYTCLCKCSRKCPNSSTITSKPTTTPTTIQTTAPTSRTSGTPEPPLKLGYRINSYPWFVKTR